MPHLAASQFNPLAALPQGFADVRDPALVFQPWWLAAAALMLAVTALTFFWLRKRRAQSSQSPATPPIPPIDRARAALTALRIDAQSLDDALFAVRVTAVVRNYIEDALRLPANEQTSEEFLRAIESDPRIPTAARVPLPDFLGTMDLLKFARQSLDPQRRSTFIDSADATVSAIQSALDATAPHATQPPTSEATQ